MNKPAKAAVVFALIALGFVWRPAWGLLIVFLLVEWAEDRWKELLDAIRGSRRSSSESIRKPDKLQEEFEQQQEYEREIEAAHQKSQFKHVPGLPWGDPSSYVSPEELIERERERREAEKHEQEAQEFLKREAERVVNEREEQREAQKREPDGKPPGYVH